MVHSKDEHAEPKKRHRGFWSEFFSVALFALIIVLPLRIAVAEPFVVNGASMDPTFETGDYLIIDKISYRLDSPERGDVVVFRFPLNPQKFFIKRLIGLPGETINISGPTVTIVNTENPNGFSLDEPYLTHFSSDNISVTLDDDEYFVLGDNRPSSSDSRVWGPLPEENIVGRAFTRLLPLGEISFYPGDSEHY